MQTFSSDTSWQNAVALPNTNRCYGVRMRIADEPIKIAVFDSIAGVMSNVAGCLKTWMDFFACVQTSDGCPHHDTAVITLPVCYSLIFFMYSIIPV